MKHHISYFYNALLEHHLLHQAHRRSQDFSEGGCAQRLIQDFWLGDDGRAKRGMREAPERRGVGSGVGCRSPSPVWGLGHSPQKIFEI